MFDNLPPEPTALKSADDAAIVAAIEEWGRIEAAAGARKLDAIAELERRGHHADDKRGAWACDPWDDTAAQVAAALNLRHRKASGQMHIALTLRRRLPRIGTLFLDGRISAQLVSTIAWRTRLITDDDVLARVDAALAERAASWGPLPEVKLEQTIDRWIDRYDPAAVHHTRTKARSRDVRFGGLDDTDPAGTRAMWGRLFATDAKLVERKLDQMARGVCDGDPRTLGQRRADALGALAAGSGRLTCQCGTDECSNSAADGRAASVIIHVVADEAAVAEKPDPHVNGRRRRDTPQCCPDKPAAALLMGGSILPTPLLAELIKLGASVRPVPDWANTPPEPRYQPSAKLQEYVRCRDLTCRFPGCEEPAEFCDVDHTIPYPVGPTHPSNLKCLCRKHHLLKTFWTGVNGWADQQLADGTVVWTAPTGQTYTTKPGGKVFFPRWNTTTAKLALPQAVSPVNGRGLLMPRRRRTRTAERAQRIKQERALNAADRAHWAQQAAEAAQNVAVRNKPPPPPTEHEETVGIWGIKPDDDIDDDPPPF